MTVSRKMERRGFGGVVCLILCLACILSLAACHKGVAPQLEVSAEKTPSAAESTPTADEHATTETALDKSALMQPDPIEKVQDPAHQLIFVEVYEKTNYFDFYYNHCCYPDEDEVGLSLARGIMDAKGTVLSSPEQFDDQEAFLLDDGKWYRTAEGNDYSYGVLDVSGREFFDSTLFVSSSFGPFLRSGQVFCKGYEPWRRVMSVVDLRDDLLIDPGYVRPKNLLVYVYNGPEFESVGGPIVAFVESTEEPNFGPYDGEYCESDDSDESEDDAEAEARNSVKIYSLSTRKQLNRVELSEIGKLTLPMFPVKTRDGLWGYMNIQGEMVMEPVFVEASHFVDGIAVVWLTHDQIGKLCGDGNTPPTAKNPIVLATCREYTTEGQLRLEKIGSNTYARINVNGEVISRFDYAEIDTADADERLTIIERNGLYGYIDKNGNEMIEPKYADGRPFMNGLGRVELSARQILQLCGNGNTPPQTDNPNVLKACEERAQIGSTLQQAFINEEGQIISRFDYDDTYALGYGPITVGDLFRQLDHDASSKGFAIVKRKGLAGYINERGEEVIKPTLRRAKPFKGGSACVQLSPEFALELCGTHGKPPATDNPVVLEACQKHSVNGQFDPSEFDRWDFGWAIMDEAGKIISPFSSECISDSVALLKRETPQGFEYYVGKDKLPVQSCITRSKVSGILGIVDCLATPNGFIDTQGRSLGKQSFVLNEGWEGNAESAKIQWLPAQDGKGFFLHDASGKKMSAFRVASKPKVTLYGLSFFKIAGEASPLGWINAKEEEEKFYPRGWINAEGTILWPPQWNDPCTDTSDNIMWPEHSCREQKPKLEQE